MSARAASLSSMRCSTAERDDSFPEFNTGHDVEPFREAPTS
jgi:hypothetical protein